MIRLLSTNYTSVIGQLDLLDISDDIEDELFCTYIVNVMNPLTK